MSKIVRFIDAQGKCYMKKEFIHADISAWHCLIDFGIEGRYFNDNSLDYQEIERIEYKLGSFKLIYVSGCSIIFTVSELSEC